MTPAPSPAPVPAAAQGAGTVSDAATAFREVLGAWPTGVVVITARHEGALAGLVSNSFTSVSLEPPIVSWCVDRSSSSAAVWLAARGFAVHVLGAEQSDLVKRFARRGGDKFAGLHWTEGVTGSPLLDGALARLECRTWQRYDGGDHVIVLGRVIGMSTAPGAPLWFHRGRLTPVGA